MFVISPVHNWENGVSLTRRANRARVSRCRMRSRGATAVDRRPGIVSRSDVSRHRRRGAKGKLAFLTRSWHRPAVRVVMVIVREVDATVVPWVAVSAALGFETGERSLGSIARGMLEKRAGRVGAIPTGIEQRRE